MLLMVVFVLVLIMCFAIVFFFTSSNEAQVAVRRRLAAIENEPRTRTVAEASILKQVRLSPTPAIHDLLVKVPGTDSLLTLLKQAGPEWWVSSILFYSFLLFFVGVLFGFLAFENIILILLTAVVAGFLPIGYLMYLRHRKL